MQIRHCFLRKALAHFFVPGLFVCYARISCTVSTLVCLLRTNLTRCFVFGLLVVHKNLTHCSSLVCLLRKNLAHYLFSCLFVCLFVTQESRALFFLLFVCYARISRTVSSLLCLFVTLESRALFLLWFVCYARISRTISWLLRFFCYARIPRSVSSLVCMFVRKEYDTPILLCRLWFVCLLRKNLAHYFMAASFFSLRENPAQCFMSGLFVCYARISQILFFWFVRLFACSRNSKYFCQRYREKYSSFNTDDHFLDLQN